MQKFKIRSLLEVLTCRRGSTEPDPSKTSEPDLTNYVPKGEYDKAIKDAEAKVAGLKKDLDTTKLELLDPDYLEWRETKQTKPAQKVLAQQSKEGDRVAALESKIEQLSESLNVTRQVAERLYFDKELENTRRDYPDFDEYKEDVEKILTASKAPVTYKQAYLMAKDTRARAQNTDKETPKQTKEPPKTEKPSNTVQAKVLEKKDYKTVAEADAATLAEMHEKYPNLGDKL